MLGPLVVCGTNVHKWNSLKKITDLVKNYIEMNKSKRSSQSTFLVGFICDFQISTMTNNFQ